MSDLPEKSEGASRRTRKQKPLSEIYILWDQLADTRLLPDRVREPSADHMAKWEKLHAMAWQDGGWVCSLTDAQLVASMGHWTFFRLCQYGLALEHIEKLSLHPDFAEIDRWELETFHSYCAMQLFNLGRYEEAIGHCEVIRKDQRHGRSGRLEDIFSIISIALDELEPDSAVPTQMKDYAADLASEIAGRKRSVKAILACHKVSDLKAILDPRSAEN